MAEWIRFTAPAAASWRSSSPAHAVQYLTVGEAQKQAFPSANFAVCRRSRLEGAAAARPPRSRSRDRQASLHRLCGGARPGRRSCGSKSCNTASPTAARSEPELARPIRRQDQAAARCRSGSDIRNISGATLSSHPRDRRREENNGHWTASMASAAHGRCSALSSTCGCPARRAGCAIEAAFAAVAEVHRLMSFHEPEATSAGSTARRPAGRRRPRRTYEVSRRAQRSSALRRGVRCRGRTRAAEAGAVSPRRLGIADPPVRCG